MIRTFFSLFSAALLLMFGTVAQAQPATESTQPAAAQPAGVPGGLTSGASSAYVLGRDDAVQVGLLGGGGNFGGQTRIQADGTIQLPLIGKVPAADKTTAELADAIRKALQAGGFYNDPVVVVEVTGYASRYVTVLGLVGNPGLVPINRPYRMSEILARVGGVRDGAADYLVVRPAQGAEKRLLIKDLATGGLDADPYVAAGDKIYAPVAEMYYISGQVNSPGAFAIQSGITVRQAIAKAGGLTVSGNDKKVDVTRGGQKVKLGLDDVVQAGDTLKVGERLF